nr:TPA_asm: movement protein [Holcus ophiovirus]
MAKQVQIGQAANSGVLKRDGRKGKELAMIPSVSFAKATEGMVEEGITVLASLSSDTAMSPEIECMAAEFKDAITGDINSIVSPMMIKLTEKEGAKKVKLGTMQSLVASLPKHNYPFYRVDRLKILYLPLFPEEEATGEKITFSINDSSIKVGLKSKSVSKTSCPLNKMSMVELSSSYFIPKAHLSMIEFCYKTQKVPVRGRAFAFVCLSFYIHREYVPMTIKKKNPVVLLIDNIELPKDINKTSSIKNLVETVNKRIEAKKGSFEAAQLKYDDEEEERNSSMRFTNNIKIESLEEDEETSGGYDSGAEVENNYKPIREKDVLDLLPRKVPIHKGDHIILDTGAPDHWFYNPGLVGFKERVGNKPGRRGETHFAMNGMEVKLGSHWVRMKEVLYANKDDFPLISYQKLVKGGIVDCLKSESDDVAVLLKDDKIVFELDCSGNYMVFKKSNNLSPVVLVEK